MPRRTHGMTNSPEYIAYKDAKARCENTSHKKWKDYGGRGIKFLFSSFEEFYSLLGKRPKGKSLDRFPNNDGNYCQGNVRWATTKQQQNNQRRRTASTSNTGFIGVYRRKNNGKFAARLIVQGKRFHLGNFDTLEKAVEARKQQENIHVRCTKYIDHETGTIFYDYNSPYKASTKVAQDETTEQVFSRKDRKAYREAIKQRTEASTRHKKRQASTLGKEVVAKTKTSSAKTRA
jgi:hypothetical protein